MKSSRITFCIEAIIPIGMVILFALLFALCTRKAKPDEVNPGYDEAVLSSLADAQAKTSLCDCPALREALGQGSQATTADEKVAQSRHRPDTGALCDESATGTVISPVGQDCPREEIRRETWRCFVDAAEERIRERNPDLGYEDTRYLARAFVAAGRDLGLPLGWGMVLADCESGFHQEAIGKAGERSVMQVKPFKGRPMAEIAADPRFAVRWALENLVKPKYDSQGITAALFNYNHSRRYVNKVLRTRQEHYKGGLWELVPK